MGALGEIINEMPPPPPREGFNRPKNHNTVHGWLLAMKTLPCFVEPRDCKSLCSTGPSGLNLSLSLTDKTTTTPFVITHNPAVPNIAHIIHQH